MKSSQCKLYADRKTKELENLQAPGEVPLRILKLVAVLSETGVEPLDVSRTFVAKTEAEAKAGTKKGFGDAACYIFFPSLEGIEKFPGARWAACTGRHNKTDFDTKLFRQSNSCSKMGALKTVLTCMCLRFTERSNGWS